MVCPGFHIKTERISVTSEKGVYPRPRISDVYVRVCQRYLSVRSSDYLSVREICSVIILLPVSSGRSLLYYFKEYCLCVLQYCKYLCKGWCLYSKRSYIDVLPVVV